MAQDSDARTVVAFPQTPDAIELRHLRSFVAVAEELNFGRAAARLYISQPALSRQIRALERLMGCDLLRRSTRQVELTLAGESLLDRVRDLLRDLDNAVSSTRSIGGKLAGRAAVLWDNLSAAVADADLQQMRAAYEAIQEQFAPPPEVDVRPVNAGGVPSLRLSTNSDTSGTVLYLHGGGYVMGSAFGYRPLAGALAAAADTTVLLPEYRLAPEHTFPAAIDDSLNAYLWLLEQGTRPQQVICAGDSAGGGLVLSLLLSLKEHGFPIPGGALLLSPGVDPTCQTLAKTVKDEQDIAKARRCVQLYLAGHPIDDPLVSPLTADLTGLPPMLVQTATGDPLRYDAQCLVDRASDHGVDARIELYPGDTHNFHMFWSFLPEAADALQQAGEFIDRINSTASPELR